jgi:hypothetical protein
MGGTTKGWKRLINMPQSARLLELKKRLTILRRHLLPADLSATGSYSLRVLDRTRGYRVLVHAEFEAYLEDRCWAVASGAIQQWKLDKKPRHVLMSLLTRCGPDASNGQTLADRIGKAGNGYHHLIQNNHGIRESNLMSLLQPVGIELTDLDGTWVSTVDSFGKARGEVAHTAVGAQRPIDPRTELTTVKQLRDGFGDLDELINSLK